MTSTATRIEYLGHAGFVVDHGGVRILIDPWFYPAFLSAWFPWPDNRFLLDRVAGRRFDYLYVSHLHEDHFDHRVLDALPRDVRVLCPNYRSRGVARRFEAMGFRHLIRLGHQETHELAPGLRATMYLDVSHKEDSGLLLDLGGFRFFDVNDCNTPFSELPTGIDLLAAQFSGAMWYPNCYDYPPAVMQRKVDQVRAGLLETLARKCQVTGAKAYLPSAGPACFLDPVLMKYNDRATTIFPAWDDVEAEFRAASPDVRVLPTLPGDVLVVRDGAVTREAYAGTRPAGGLEEYSHRRATEWGEFQALPDEPVTDAEVAAYFSRLQRRNRHLLRDFAKALQVVADGQTWLVRLGELAEDYVIEGEEPYDPNYFLLMPNRVLRAVLDGRVGWEEALLSMRVNLRRKPDVFDSRLMGLLRYGNEPVQTLQMSREMKCKEFIERDGVSIPRYCPHAGEDLSHARICDGVLECPRHHWKWDLATGECIEGGSLPLQVRTTGEPLAAATLRDS